MAASACGSLPDWGGVVLGMEAARPVHTVIVCLVTGDGGALVWGGFSWHDLSYLLLGEFLRFPVGSHGRHAASPLPLRTP